MIDLEILSEPGLFIVLEIPERDDVLGLRFRAGVRAPQDETNVLRREPLQEDRRDVQTDAVRGDHLHDGSVVKDALGRVIPAAVLCPAPAQ